MSKKKVYEYIKNDDIYELAVDSHAHLDRYENPNSLIKQMKDDGLAFIVMMAGDIKTANWAKDFSSANQNLYFMYGVHPFEIDEFDESEVRGFFEENKSNRFLVGLGEIGLDYSRTDDQLIKKQQEEVFVSQLIIANEYKLPVAIHIRDAHDDAIRILTENKMLLNNSGIIHCCSANVDEVKAYLDLGFYISFSGTITYGKKNADYYLEETLKQVPLQKLLIETDAPFLCPAPYRGKQNEPKYVLVTAEKIAELLDMPVNELIKITRENTLRLLKI